MKFPRKHVAVTAGLAAVLSLTPVMAPVAQVFANDGDAATTQAANQIDVTLKYGNNTAALVADKDGHIDVSFIDQTGIKEWVWTDSEGNGHSFPSSMLAIYIFSESCTVTAVYAEPSVTYRVTSPIDGSYYQIEANLDENGMLAAPPSDPAIEGCTFTGWAVNGDTDNIYTSGAIGSTAWKDGTYFVAQFVVDGEPGDEQPGTDEPGTDEPGTEEPGTDKPDTEQPGDEQPGTDEEQPAASDEEKADEKDEETLAETGDAAGIVGIVAAAGASIAGLGAYIKRRH